MSKRRRHAGDNDFFCPQDAATRLHLELHTSKLLVIEQCGHFTWLEQPELFNTRVPESLTALGLGSKSRQRTKLG